MKLQIDFTVPSDIAESHPKYEEYLKENVAEKLAKEIVKNDLCMFKQCFVNPTYMPHYRFFKQYHGSIYVYQERDLNDVICLIKSIIACDFISNRTENTLRETLRILQQNHKLKLDE